MEEDFRRVAAYADLPRVLETCGWIRRTFEPYGALGPLGEHREGIGAIVQGSRSSLPVLLVIIPLRQGPDFVTAIVNPAACGFRGRDIFSFVDRVDEQIGMSVETDLDEPATQLRNEGQLHPVIRNLLCLPTFIDRGVNLAWPRCSACPRG